MTKNRIAITGMGAICGLGHTLPEVWGNIIEGRPGISKLEHSYIGDDISVKIGGEVKNFTVSEELIPAKEVSRYDKFIHLALHSANEAYNHSGLASNSSMYDSYRIGCVLGCGMGGFPIMEQAHSIYLEKGARRISPFLIPSIIPNMASGLTSIRFGLKGINYTLASACASSAHAISAACYEIEHGRQDVMVTGGTESVFSSLPVGGFASMKAITRTHNDTPEKSSRPFDVDRDGFVIGEGAGILVIENLEKAKARGATIYAEIVGHGATSDAHHITAPHPEGEGAIRCMNKAIEYAGISPEDIGYINAHGTSTPLGDIAETIAVKKTFGKHAKNLYVSSTKSMVGHLLGAAGGVESIFSAMVLCDGIIPPTINLDNQDSKCDLNYVPNKAIKSQVEYSLSNSFGFGGTNASIIFKRYQN